MPHRKSKLRQLICHALSYSAVPKRPSTAVTFHYWAWQHPYCGLWRIKDKAGKIGKGNRKNPSGWSRIQPLYLHTYHWYFKLPICQLKWFFSSLQDRSPLHIYRGVLKKWKLKMAFAIRRRTIDHGPLTTEMSNFTIWCTSRFCSKDLLRTRFWFQQLHKKH